MYQLKTPWNKFRNYLTDFCDMNDDSSLYAVPLRMISGWILYNRSANTPLAPLKRGNELSLRFE
ncbi:MAG: hypothetical protein ACI8U0_002584 [Flavobacteriales bacterium]